MVTGSTLERGLQDMVRGGIAEPALYVDVFELSAG